MGMIANYQAVSDMELEQGFDFPMAVNDNTMVELANLCGYLKLDFDNVFTTCFRSIALST